MRTRPNGGKPHPNSKDKSGLVFGRLTVLYRIIPAKNYRYKWMCQCSCGNQVPVESGKLNVRTPHTQSCGCLHTDVMKERHQLQREKEGPNYQELRTQKRKLSKRQYAIDHKEQITLYGRNYRRENAERIKVLNHIKYEKNKEKIITRTKTYWAAHPEQQKATLKRFRDKDPEAYRKYQREWSKLESLKHPEKVRARRVASESKRRARKRRADVNSKGIAVWMRQIRALPFARCHWCGTKVSGRNVHFDHVIALANGGSHTIGNLCSSCPDCNLTKQDRELSKWIVEGQSFLPI